MPDDKALTLRQADSLYQGFPDFAGWKPFRPSPAAVHEFLRAQIGDHRTGDPLHGHAQ